MLTLFETINNLVWGPPLLILLMGTGLYLTLRLGGLQFVRLPKALSLIVTDKADGQGEVSSFAALCTALAATVGTGNIVGVATAITSGGPGALFWMWVAGFLGMATKYAEGLLAIKFRTKDENGQASGGPMYYITLGMGDKWKPLAVFFSISGILVALFGMGTFAQVNAISSALENSLSLSPKLVSLVLAALVATIIFGGIQSISKISTAVVPFMALAYITATLWILATHAEKVLPSLALVFSSAMSPTAAVGGFAGTTVKNAIQKGVARGVFSNESGLGSAPIAAAAAKSNNAVEQGLISMTGTFIDTIVICSLTGLTLLVTGQWTGNLVGAPLTQAAFATSFSTAGGNLLALCLTLFAFTTILGWSYYGERCFTFVFGSKHLTLYRLLFVLMVALGGFLKLDLVWVLADIVNALMALPNLIAILALSPVIVAETKAYFSGK